VTGGYMGKVLRVNLTSGEVWDEHFDDATLRKWIGGSGLATKLLMDETEADTDPLGFDNLLISITGPMTATPAFYSGRHQIVAKSPLSGVWGRATVGGSWGSMCKRSGYDGIIVMGKSTEPVFLYVSEGHAEIRGASHLWGLDTYRTDERIKKETHPQAVTECIGPAGEKLVRIACVMTDGRKARAAGRCGMGAVFGSKNLKAITVFGTQEVPVFNAEELGKRLKAKLPIMRQSPVWSWVRDYGTSLVVEGAEVTGDLPVKNWQGSRFEAKAKIGGVAQKERLLVKPHSCAHCVLACGRIIANADHPDYPVEEGGGMEYETLGQMGSNCLVEDIGALAKANELCSKYGLDTVEVGAAVAFAMEAYEKGLLDDELIGGMEIKWGDADVLVNLTRQIGEREGLGAFLGQGLKRVSEQLGGLALEMAVHTKGVAFPAHDPRAKFGSAVSYATSNRGACHIAACAHDFEGSNARRMPPELGYGDQNPSAFVDEGQGVFVAKLQDYYEMQELLSICKFGSFTDVTTTDLIDWTNLITGWDMTLEEYMITGERAWNLQRLYNVRCGISRKDDALPLRILMLAGEHSERAGKLPCLNIQLAEYYRHRRWDEFGIPTRAKLVELGLEDYLSVLPY